MLTQICVSIYGVTRPQCDDFEETKMYFHFLSFLDIDMAQAVEICFLLEGKKPWSFNKVNNMAADDLVMEWALASVFKFNRNILSSVPGDLILISVQTLQTKHEESFHQQSIKI